MSEFTVNSAVPSDQSTTLNWIISHLSRHKVLIFILLIGAFGNAALAAAIPIFLGRAFDVVSTEPVVVRGLLMAAIGIVVSQVVRAVLQFGRNFSSAILGERLERDMREELYISLLGKSMTFHDSQPVGDTMARATNDVHEINLMLQTGMNLVVGSGNFLLMPLIISPTIDPQLILAPGLFVIAYLIAVRQYLGVLTPVANRVRESFGRLNSRLAEAIDGIELVKGSAQEAEEIARFEKNAFGYRNRVVDQGNIEARFLPLLFLGLTQAIGFTHSILLFQNGRIQLGDVVAFNGLLTLFFFPTFVSLMAYSRVSLGFAGARRILELIHVQNDLDENVDGYRERINGRLQFNNVSFGYVEGVKVIEDISFTVEPGQRVAIVGQTGSGKSSLTKLINRTYDVTEGEILIDGVNVKAWQMATLRQQISIIEQDIFLFSRTISENIAFGNPKATFEEVVDAAKAAQAHEFILNFQDGYDTIIGERGVTLSGGQRQRLALARAFLIQPRLLILDDSTSAVDSATEDQIQKAIVRAAENQTTILITHRLSQIRWADLVIVLRKGKISAIGDHESLLESSAAYRNIFRQYEAID
ncbi:MAG: ABC transporter ATP-binding protein [Chloroflexota bacterium]